MPALANKKHEAFTCEYAVSKNATRAALAAGYSPRTAGSQGHDLLKKPDISARIDELLAEAAERAKVKLDDVIAAYQRIAFSGMSKFMRVSGDGDPVIDLSTCTPEDLDLLSEATVEDFTEGRGEDARNVRRIKIKTYDRLNALEKLARHLGMFKDEKDPASQAIDAMTALVREINAKGSASPIKAAS